VDLLSGGGGVNWTDYRCFLIFFRFFPSHSINGSKLQISASTTHFGPSLYNLFNLQSTLAKSFTMAKGKNHDRKANPGFGKTNGKANASTAGGEFTLKRVKG
jgi:hypothetical protein